jgi:hypothetical protein
VEWLSAFSDQRSAGDGGMGDEVQSTKSEVRNGGRGIGEVIGGSFSRKDAKSQGCCAMNFTRYGTYPFGHGFT